MCVWAVVWSFAPRLRLLVCVLLVSLWRLCCGRGVARACTHPLGLCWLVCVWYVWSVGGSFRWMSCSLVAFWPRSFCRATALTCLGLSSFLRFCFWHSARPCVSFSHVGLRCMWSTLRVLPSASPCAPLFGRASSDGSPLPPLPLSQSAFPVRHPPLVSAPLRCSVSLFYISLPSWMPLSPRVRPFASPLSRVSMSLFVPLPHPRHSLVSCRKYAAPPFSFGGSRG